MMNQLVFSSTRRALTCAKPKWQVATPSSSRWQPYHKPHYASVSVSAVPLLVRPSPVIVQRYAFSSAAASRKKRRKPKKQVQNPVKNDGETSPLALLSTSFMQEHPRPVLTDAVALHDPAIVALDAMSHYTSHNAKSLLHNAKHKLGFTEHISFHQMGANHEPLFVATRTTTLDLELLDLYSTTVVEQLQDHPHTVVVNNNTVEFVTRGAAPVKKRAELLAAVDTMVLLDQVGIDIRDPPNLIGLFKQKEHEQQSKSKHNQEAVLDKAKLEHALMMLEVLNASRPTFSTVAEQHGKQQTWTATASVLVRGTSVEATGLPARKKSHAEGNALIALVNDHIPQVIGDDEWNAYTNLTLKSSTNNNNNHQTAILKIPVLDDEIRAEVKSTLGTWHDHEMRRQRHGLATLEYEWGLREKRLLQQEEQEEREAMMMMTNSNMQDDQDEWGKEQEQRKHLQQQQQRLDAISKELYKQEQKRLQKELHNATKHPNSPPAIMKQIRDALPIQQIQHDLIQTLEHQQVVVVSGGTGSGKSTQCPQYILEHALLAGKGAHTRILVTQPRKIAAISVAERVAAERQDRIGHSVGYTVRFQRKPPRQSGGSLEFVTTGVLLRRLLNDPTLEDISHVVIDEVHERDIDTDFLLILLRDLLAQRPDLRVILMSATLDAESFGHYFSKQHPHDGLQATTNNKTSTVPVLSVPTQPRHPVEVFYLEDIAANNAITHRDATTTTNNNNNNNNNNHQFPKQMQKLATSLLQHKDEQLQMELEEALEEERAAEELEKLSRAEDEGETLESDSDSDSDSDELKDDNYDNEDVSSSKGLRLSYNDKKLRVETLQRAVSMRTSSSPSSTPTTVGAKKGSRPSRSQQQRQQQQRATDNDKFNPTEVMISLMVQIAHHLSQVETDAGRSGSILCFLPGLDEIKAATAELEETMHPRLKNKIAILPLHSTIPQEDQQKVFQPANGKIKVIFSTNIAESSITIDDVLAVIDSGLVRELNFDAEAAMTKMETNAASRASATQRLGRAGRVAPGRCYRIYSRGDMEAMAERPTPEIQRTALEATCLQTCSMTNTGVANFLSRALDPPPYDAVSFAMDRLIKLGAISVVDNDDEKNGGEVLTPLGRCLSRLPLDPATGRMLMMAAVLKCLDPILTAAACFSSRNVFNNPVGRRDEAQEVRRSLSDSSDVMAMLRAYDNFWDLVEYDGWHSAKEWAYDNFVSVPAMVSIQAVRFQLVEQLNTLGLIPASDMKRVGHRKLALLEDASVNENSNNEMLFSALWATAFPGNLAARRRHAAFGTLRTQMDAHAGLHPSSVSFHRKPPKNTVKPLPSWYMYREMVLSSQVFLRDCSALDPYQVLVFGGFSLSRNSTTTSNGEKRRFKSRVRGVLDDWIIVEGPSVDTFDLLAIARNEITMALEYKAMHPKAALPEETQNILNSICYMFDTMNEEKGDGLDNDTMSGLRGSLWGLLDTKDR